MKWISIKDKMPSNYIYVILGRYIDENDEMCWQIGRFLPGIGFEFYTPGENSGPYCGDSFWDFKPSQTTHWLELPMFNENDSESES